MTPENKGEAYVLGRTCFSGSECTKYASDQVLLTCSRLYTNYQYAHRKNHAKTIIPIIKEPVHRKNEAKPCERTASISKSSFWTAKNP